MVKIFPYHLVVSQYPYDTPQYTWNFLYDSFPDITRIGLLQFGNIFPYLIAIGASTFFIFREKAMTILMQQDKQYLIGYRIIVRSRTFTNTFPEFEYPFFRFVIQLYAMYLCIMKYFIIKSGLPA